MDNNYSIVGVDVGGTSICVGLLVGNEIVEYFEAPTGAQRDANAILLDLVELIKLVIKPNTIGIGLGVPGLVDANNGVIYNINNISSWRNFPLRTELLAHFNVPIFINNDANCFALGEYFFGLKNSCSSLVGITLGTGVGAGVVVNGKLHTGILGCAGEIGGMPYKDGDFEMYCSSKFFDTSYNLSGSELYDLALSGNLDAINGFTIFGSHLGKLLKNIMFVLAPDKIVIGGSITKGADLFMGSLTKEVQLFPYKPILERTSISVSHLLNSAILGAAALVLNGRE